MDQQTMHDSWPALAVQDWASNRDTLHMWVQIVGKIRMAHQPLVNHWWQAPLYVSARGLTTSSIPYGTGSFDIEFDFHDHELLVRTSAGPIGRITLGPKSVADFYTEMMLLLTELGYRRPSRGGPTKCKRPSRSPTTPNTSPTTRNQYTHSGASSSKPTASFTSSAHGSPARSAPCTSSGAQWTWRVPDSRAGERRSTLAVHPPVPTGSSSKATHGS